MAEQGSFLSRVLGIHPAPEGYIRVHVGDPYSKVTKLISIAPDFAQVEQIKQPNSLQSFGIVFENPQKLREEW